ncbi:tripeptide aminopeptidase [Clostridium moniliforme]|uniref:Peptidase T n=1 Tax=Clostridium moniliforme TaxID=39489 RepID=A0ABS4EXL2_9CLOT|nr:peptidase T [Clostridium moniliforme]MBP1888735.1 tripeptide aminopeptidase [Clostridium moniliforme]
MKKVEDRFLEYVKVDTKSDETTRVTPSTEGQLKLGKILESELKEVGLKDVHVDKFGYVYATLPSNSENKNIPTIGFISHMDTAPDISGKDVKPQIVKNYDGSVIVLNKELDVKLDPKELPELKDYIGKTLITTDGTTLLGADDKAGVSEIITAMEYLINHPEIKHGEIKVGFTPDEEIGEGADHFNVEGFGAKYAYTVDGGALGELEYENFNAAGAKVTIIGKNVHPGSAKGKMINSILVAHEFLELLPLDEVPEKTENYEGFSFLLDINGEVEKTEMSFIIRDFFEDEFNRRKEEFVKAAETLNKKYGKEIVKVEIKDQYRNMKEKIDPVMFVVDIAKKAMEMADVTPKIQPIRGGTDGARLSFMGLPTPNMFTGGENFHGRYEYIAIESMEKAVETIINIVKLYSER